MMQTHNCPIFFILNIYGLFTNIFSSIHFVDKLSFKLVSSKCKKLIENRLADKILCDDYDEYNLCTNKNNRFEEKFTKIKYTQDLKNIIDKLLRKNSIICLKKFLNLNLLHSKCYILYFIQLSIIHNKSIADDYKLMIDKHIFNKFCEDKMKCSYCSYVFFSHIESDLIVTTNFYDGFTYKQIVHLMIIAGVHGSYNVFDYFYNHLVCTLGYKTYQLDMMMLLINYYKYYYINIYPVDTKKKLFRYSKPNNIDKQHNKILQQFSEQNSKDSELLDENIFKKFDQSIIKNLFIICINNNSASDALIFIKYINKIDNVTLSKIFFKINTKKFTYGQTKLKNILIEKFGLPPKNTLNIQELSTKIKIPKQKNHKIIKMFKNYYTDVYTYF